MQMLTKIVLLMRILMQSTIFWIIDIGTRRITNMENKSVYIIRIRNKTRHRKTEFHCSIDMYLFIYLFIYLLYLIIVPSLSIKDRAYLQITIVLPHQGKTKEKSRYSNVTSSSFTYQMLFWHMLCYEQKCK